MVTTLKEAASIRAHAALLTMAVIWAVNFSVSKVALQEVSPLAFNGLRFPFAAVLLYLALRRRGRIVHPTKSDRVRLALLGLFGNLFYQVFFIFGLYHTTAGNASLLLAGTPIVTALLSSAVGHERVSLRVWIGVLATFAGILLIVTTSLQRDVGQGSILGDLIMLGATITWALYTVGSKPLIVRYDSITVTAWTLWMGTIGLVLVGLPDVLSTDFAALTWGTWAAILYAGALSIGVAYMFWYYGVQEIGNTRTSVYTNLVPILALATAWLWLGEVPAVMQLVGAGIIIAGVTIAQTRVESPKI
jgi:drug/metabolite transporter (DMT)-like permease